MHIGMSGMVKFEYQKWWVETKPNTEKTSQQFLQYMIFLRLVYNFPLVFPVKNRGQFGLGISTIFASGEGLLEVHRA